MTKIVNTAENEYFMKAFEYFMKAFTRPCIAKMNTLKAFLFILYNKLLINRVPPLFGKKPSSLHFQYRVTCEGFVKALKAFTLIIFQKNHYGKKGVIISIFYISVTQAIGARP
jgi:hypothetical protein